MASTISENDSLRQEFSPDDADSISYGSEERGTAIAAAAAAVVSQPDPFADNVGAGPTRAEQGDRLTVPAFELAGTSANYPVATDAGDHAPAPDAAGGAPVVTGPAPIPDENGSAVTSTSVAASGDQRIDGILGGTKWSGSSITYSDPDAAGDYQAGYNSDGNSNGISAQNESFSQLSAQEMISLHFALNSVIYTQPAGAAGFSAEGFTNLTIDYNGAGSGTATIRVANSSDPGTSYAYRPDNSAYGGDVFIGTSARTPTAGNYSWFTMIHEVGHALGLKHGHETGGFGALPANVNSMEYSIMTYATYIGQSPLGSVTFETWGAPQTFMMLDIAALQHMYGADYTTNSGDTVYSWSQTTGETYVNGSIAIDPGANRIFATIWDGGGIDTYDLSNYTVAVNIDLGPGDYSTFSAAQRAYLGGGPNEGYARGNIFNALMYQGNTASLIENANGGTGNDTLAGNQIANVLTGNNGNDSMQGLEGNDTLFGGAGNDTADGWSGNDSANGGTGNDVLYGYTGNDTLNGGDDNDRLFGEGDNDWLDGWYGADSLYGGSGNDTLLGFEGNDSLDGSTGADSLAGESGNDTLSGSTDNDTLSGGSGFDTLLGGDGNDSLDGGSDNDTLEGGVGLDTVLGGTGDDVVVWGSGDVDYHDGGDGIDTIRTNAISFSSGALFNMAAGTYTFGSFVETWANFENFAGATNTASEAVIGSSANNNIATGSGNNSIDGASGNDTLLGGDGDDTLTGGGNDDSVFGGAGNDVVDWDFGTDTIDGGTGIDTIRTDGSFVVGAAFDLGAGTYSYEDFTETFANFENYDGTAGAGSEAVTGSAGDNSIAGGSGNNSLDGVGGNDTVSGGAGNDTLKGGLGDDSILGGDGNDVVYWEGGTDTINGGTGTDTIRTTSTFLGGTVFDFGAGTYTFGSFVESWIGFENYEGSGSGIEQVVGSSGNNLITTGAGANLLEGRIGSDTLNGGGGNDTLLGGFGTDSVDGGTGNDLIRVLIGEFIDDVDGGTGIDTLDMSSETTEALTADLGAGTQTGMGGTRALLNVENVIGTQAGDNITGGAGGNSIDGQSGNDVLTAAGTGAADTLQGGDGSDTLTSVGARADVLDGGADAVTDYLVLDRSASASALVFTVADQTVAASLSTGGSIVNFDLYNVAATGLADQIDIAGDGTVSGNAGNDSLTMTTGSDLSVLYGGVGNDTLAMTLTASAGLNYAYLSGGDDNDRVTGISSGGNFNFQLYGDAGNDTVTASTGNDYLFGGLGSDSLVGGDGADYIVDDDGIIGAAADTIVAGAGADYIYSYGGADRIDGGDDADYAYIDRSTAAGGLTLKIVSTGATAILSTGGTLKNVETVSIIATAFNDSIALAGGADYIAAGDGNDTLVGGADADTIFGQVGNDSLDGGLGNDSLIGGDGEDTYVVDSYSDILVDSSGTDTIRTNLTWALAADFENLVLTGTAAVNGTGNGGMNYLTGNANVNTLDGSLGADTMAGGAASDIYIVDDVGDVAVEISTGGSLDTVRAYVDYTLSVYVENLQLMTAGIQSGTGNTIANTLTGGAGDNSMYGLQGNDTLIGNDGNDYLDGGIGLDSLRGGNGNDTYIVDNIGDVTIEAGGSGVDTVRASVDYTMTSGIETLVITSNGTVSGTGNTVANTLTGAAGNNSLYGMQGDDTLEGFGGADLLDGGTGADSMLGGAGADTYIVDNAGDLVDETGGSGIDLVMSSLATYSLTAGVDNLILTRTSAANGIGNVLANNITGTGFNDVLSGLDGKDTLFGAAGNDTLLGGTGNDVFGFAAGSGDDRIDDFIDGQDKLDASAFGYHSLAEFSSGGGSIAASGGNTLVTFNAAGDTALLIGIAPAAITTADFIWAV